MTDYASVRLEKAGVVVAYFAPTAVVDSPHNNETVNIPRPGASKTAIARDRTAIVSEVQIHCEILGTDDGLPADHVAALQAAFGTGGTVTAEDQVRRLLHYFHEVGGQFNFFHRTRSYAATTDAGVNIVAGTFPAVIIKNVQETWNASYSRCKVFVVLQVGLRSPG